MIEKYEFWYSNDNEPSNSNRAKFSDQISFIQTKYSFEYELFRLASTPGSNILPY